MWISVPIISDFAMILTAVAHLAATGLSGSPGGACMSLAIAGILHYGLGLSEVSHWLANREPTCYDVELNEFSSLTPASPPPRYNEIDF